jgi:hypothetical protein
MHPGQDDTRLIYRHQVTHKYMRSNGRVGLRRLNYDRPEVTLHSVTIGSFREEFNIIGGAVDENK